MNITIFGGSGFMGSHVADVLTDRGHDVLIFDKVVSPYLKKGQDMLVGDILDEKAVAKAVSSADVVYNFIAISEIDQANARPLETVKINVLGNLNILEACKDKGIERFVFASSIYIYSDKGSFYRSSKQSCELFIEDYQQAHGVDYTIVRFGSLYGPRSDERNWIYRTLKQAITEGRISREGDGEEIREYIHVEDAARLAADILDKKYKNRCVIITGNERYKIKDLLVMIKEMLKGKVQIEYVPVVHTEHYEMTPYVFNPKVASKIYGNEHLDMGQGLLNIMAEIHRKYSPQVHPKISENRSKR